jgi:type VI secretion system protein ImpM
MSVPPAVVGGIYGKAPAFGDFIHRRLPTSFVKPWDEWLSRSIAASQAQIPDRWTEAYLTSPPWRFALDPGVAGPAGWIGVFASSVDEVRRSYPITVAISLPAGVTLPDLSGDVEPVAAALEATALQLIAGTLTPDEATVRLEELTPMLTMAASSRPVLSRGGGERLQIGTTYDSIAIMMAHLTQTPAGQSSKPTGRSAWWHTGWNALPAANLVAHGLPAPHIFASFLDSSWRDRGWADHSAWQA